MGGRRRVRPTERVSWGTSECLFCSTPVRQTLGYMHVYSVQPRRNTKRLLPHNRRTCEAFRPTPSIHSVFLQTFTCCCPQCCPQHSSSSTDRATHPQKQHSPSFRISNALFPNQSYARQTSGYIFGRSFSIRYSLAKQSALALANRPSMRLTLRSELKLPFFGNFHTPSQINRTAPGAHEQWQGMSVRVSPSAHVEKTRLSRTHKYFPSRRKIRENANTFYTMYDVHTVP